MLSKLIQAYRTAWYYPKVAGNSRASMILDRSLFIGIPIIIAIVAFLSASRYTDTLTSVLLSTVTLTMAATLTVVTSRTEEEAVNKYLHERKTKHIALSTDKIPKITQPTADE